MTTKKTLVEASKEAGAAEIDGWTDQEIANARRVNRLAQLIEGDKQAAGLALLVQALSDKVCPASITDNQVQCMTCLLCNGKKANIGIHAHGRAASQVGIANQTVVLSR